MHLLQTRRYTHFMQGFTSRIHNSSTTRKGTGNTKKVGRPPHCGWIMWRYKAYYTVHWVTLLVILIGVMGTIYKDFTDEPLKKLGLEYNHAIKLTQELNEHSVQYATQLINTRHALHQNISDHKGTGDGALARTQSSWSTLIEPSEC
jgi:hypothetical protein